MKRTKVDWPHHLAQYQASGQSVGEYCEAAGINLSTFRYHLSKKNKRGQAKEFEEFSVAAELVIGRDHRGMLTLSGFDLAQLPNIVGAWSNALSQ